MKSFDIFFTLIAIIILSQCSKHESCKHEPSTEVYKVGLKYCIGEHEFIQIKNIDDSRCPRETECFWEGKTDISIDLFAHNTLHDAVLTVPNTEDPVVIENIFGFNITVLNISPYPQKDTNTEQSEYIVTMIVQAL